MHIAILGTRGIPARYGGFETFAEELAVGLVQRGISVTVFCEMENVDAEKSFSTGYKGVELVYVGRLPEGPLRTLTYDAISLWRARKQYDIVYMLGYGASLLCWLPRIWGRPVWINMDGLEWARAKWGWFARGYLRCMEAIATVVATRLIADAAGIRDSLLHRYPHMPPCPVISYGCYPIREIPQNHHLSEWGLCRNNYYIVVCRLEPENHVLDILDGFRQSASQKELVIVGDIGIRSSYSRELLAIKDKRVKFIGTVYDRLKIAALRYHAIAYFHGHSVGGTNPSLLEAMACGNAIIAHDNPFNREVLGESGVFFRGAEEIPKILEHLESSLPWKSSLGKRALERASKVYTWQSVFRKYEELIRLETSSTCDANELSDLPHV